MSRWTKFRDKVVKPAVGVAAVTLGGPAVYAALGGTGTAILGSALIGAYGAKKEGEAIEDASQRDIAFQREIFNQQREDTAPWREAGTQALASLQAGIAAGEFDPSNFDFTADPGYEFRLSEGVNALDRSAAARGRLQSGAQSKAVTRYGQDVASQEYGAAYQRNLQAQQQKYNVLAGMAGIGQVATSQDIASRDVMASRVGADISAAGSARASSYGGVTEAAQQGLQNYLSYNQMQPNAGYSVNDALDAGVM